MTSSRHYCPQADEAQNSLLDPTLLEITPTDSFSSQRGFTLAEMIIVIVITGILGTVVAVFMTSPIKGYFDTVRRSEMTDAADTALRRIGRDVRLALPNSVRATVPTALEFLPTTGGGRYRVGCPGNPLVFGALSDYPCATNSSANTFDVLVGASGVSVANGNSIAVYNLGIPGADAYSGDTLRAAAAPFGAALTTIGFAGAQFPLASPGNRFQVVQGPVSYICDTVARTLRRYSGYAMQATQPTNPAAPPLSTAPNVGLLADNVSACTFTYDANVIATREGLVNLTLSITRQNMAGNNETIQLYHTVHVSNVP